MFVYMQLHEGAAQAAGGECVSGQRAGGSKRLPPPVLLSRR